MTPKTHRTVPTDFTSATRGSSSTPARLVQAASIVALALAACEASDVEPDDLDAPAAEALEVDEPTHEIIENLRTAGFPDEEIEVDDEGVVWVGGDAVVSLGASREMVGEAHRGPQGGGDQFRQYRTTNVISKDLGVICVDGSAFTGTLSTALDAAIANYNDLNLTFEMLRTSGSSFGCNALITGQVTGGSGGSAGFPEGGLPFGTINIGSGVASFGTAVATHVIAHELGHCIGFRHTDFFNRSISCGVGGNEGQAGVGAHHIPGTPTGAVFDGSVMNACFNGGSTGVFPADDINALNELYGAECCTAGDGPGCGEQTVEQCVCAADSFCCNNTWDSICVNEVTSLGCGVCPAPEEHSCCETGVAGCENNVIEAGVCAADPFCCATAWDGICVNEVESLGFGLCESTCCAPQGTPGCDDGDVQACVCAADSFCCNNRWDSICVNEVESLGCGQCG